MGDNVLDLDSRRIKRTPGSRARARLDALRLAEAAHEARDPLVRAAAGDSSSEVLHLQIVELAKECAALKFDRLHEGDGRARERLSSRRLRALMSFADAVLQQLRHDAGAPSPVAIRRVTDCLRSEVEAVVTDLFPSQAAEVIQRLRAKLDAGLDAVIAEAVRAPR